MHERDVGAGAALPERHPQRVEHERGAHVGGELPADHLAAEGVDHEGEEHQPLPAPEIREVGDPELVGSAGAEVALDEIGPPLGARVGPGRPPRLAAPLGALDAVGAHQPLDAIAAHSLAGAQQRLPGAPVAVGVIVGRLQPLDALEQPLVLDGPLRALAGLAPVVGGRRHAQGPADRLDAETAALLVDEAAHFGRSASSSVAKTPTRP
jgi:hypothetical protein